VTRESLFHGRRYLAAITAFALLFFALTTWTSFAEWANYRYRTFDAAYYVQALWGLLHGHRVASLLGVPLLGNHVEPIVLIILPVFALFPHAITLVVVQNLMLAASAAVAFDLGLRSGLERWAALLLAIAALLTPVAGYIALHEFEVEALTPLCILLMLRAHLCRDLRGYWLSIAALLACKENMGLLVAAFCAVHAVKHRSLGIAAVLRWYLAPMTIALVWLILCATVITPALNAGSIGYTDLYGRLGASPGEILRNFVFDPLRFATVLKQSLYRGNLLPGLLLPFLCLPVMRPRWLVVAAPILFQHLLSWRSSEWTIYFHYAAPLLPLFWFAAVEAISARREGNGGVWLQNSLATAVVIACAIGQLLLGPAALMARSANLWTTLRADRERKNAIVASVAPTESVVAPVPFLSHLATREWLFSLHHILKGLRTLSRARYEPPRPTDLVIVDYDDSATFDAQSGYYHPAMRTTSGAVIPSSEMLLHEFLVRAQWRVQARDEISLFTKVDKPVAAAPEPNSPQLRTAIAPGNYLLGISKSNNMLSGHQPIDVTLVWEFATNRSTIPWMFLGLTEITTGKRYVRTKGLCAPEINTGTHLEQWQITRRDLPAGRYRAEAVFVDNSKRVWSEVSGLSAETAPLAAPISLGEIRCE
jgi:uncharacterized membrane protein